MKTISVTVDSNYSYFSQEVKSLDELIELLETIREESESLGEEYKFELSIEGQLNCPVKTQNRA